MRPCSIVPERASDGKEGKIEKVKRETLGKAKSVRNGERKRPKEGGGNGVKKMHMILLNHFPETNSDLLIML